MSQIRDKKAHRKHIATMNPTNAKSVQLVELHAFAYCLLFVYLSESFHFSLARQIVGYDFRPFLRLLRLRCGRFFAITPMTLSKCHNATFVKAFRRSYIFCRWAIVQSVWTLSSYLSFSLAIQSQSGY